MQTNDGATGLRIAHLIESDGPGGAEQVVVHLATALQAAGAWNLVCLPADGEGWLARQLHGSGVVVEYRRLDRPVSPAYAGNLAALLRRHRVEIAHSHEFTMAVYGAWASHRASIPHVITMHGGRYYAGRLRRRAALRASVALSERTVAVSTPLARQLSSDLWIPPSQVLTIPNGVRSRPPASVTLRGELGLRPDDGLIVSVGNLYPVKGHACLIDAVGLLSERYPALHLAIAGRGELADELADRARQHGLAERVHLLGLRDDVPAVLAAADLFVLPSLSEGLPLALLEAMFAGRAIVASDVGDVRAALAGGEAGALVPPGSAGALAEAIGGLLDSPRRMRALGDLAQRRAAGEYDVSRMVHRYAQLYASLAARRPAARTEVALPESA